MVIAAVAVLQTAVYAQSIDFSGDVTGGKSVEVTNLENGYYDLTAVCKTVLAAVYPSDTPYKYDTPSSEVFLHTAVRS